MLRVVAGIRSVVLLVGVILSAVSAFGQASFQVVGSLDPDEPTYYVHGVSGDGQVVVGWVSSADGSEAFRWTASDGIFLLGDFPGGRLRGAALGASGNGSVIVGYGVRSEVAWETTAFKWTSDTGMQELSGPGWSQAYGASADGSVIVGVAGGCGYAWGGGGLLFGGGGLVWGLRRWEHGGWRQRQLSGAL